MDIDNKPHNVYRLGILSLIGLLILGLGAGGAFWMISNRAKAKRKKPKALIPHVNTEPFERLDLETKLEAMGVVIPSRVLDMDARLSGKIVKLHKDFIPGGIIKKGETVIYIEKADYELTLLQAKAHLEKAKSELKLEQAQCLVAKNQYERFKPDTGGNIKDEELILRKPQERAKKADVAIAEANVKGAELNLARTEIKAPFDSVIISTSIEIGDQVTPATRLAKLVGTETFWVRTSLPSSKLQWLIFPQEGQPGSEATVTTKSCEKKGRIIRLLRSLEEKGRMARVLVEIEDPINLSEKTSADKYKDPLLLGEFARVELKGKTIKNLLKIPRRALHEGNEIWVADAENKLHIRKGTPIWEDRDNIYFKQEVPAGCKLITSNFGFPVQGMKLNVVEEKTDNKLEDNTTEKEKEKLEKKESSTQPALSAPKAGDANPKPEQPLLKK